MKELSTEEKAKRYDEADEDFINMLILHFNYLINKGGDSVEAYKSYREKLKSLRPQSQWKPSEEQIKALKEACDEHWEPDGLDPLYTLYQDLKKL